MTVLSNYPKTSVTKRAIKTTSKQSDRDAIQFIYIDLFCGAGGTTTGVERAVNRYGQKIAKVIACVNHDENAINSHYANHPDVEHFTEDIKTLAMKPLLRVLNRAKRKYPNALVVLWASLECTNFSNAKGGKPKDADSRTLADHLDRYVKHLKPDFIQIENVREFRDWGPVTKKGKVIKSKKGVLFNRWYNRIKSYGYNADLTMLNAADFGAYTDRRRLFITFASYGLPIVFPVGKFTQNPDKVKPDLFDHEPKQKWLPVKDVLDLDDQGGSIFTRKKPLVDRTLERIYSGLLKYVEGCKEPTDDFLIEYYGAGRAIPINRPIGTLTTKDRHAKINLTFLNPDTELNGLPVSDDEPTPTESDYYLFNPQWGGHCRSIERPCHTLIARMDKAPPYLLTTERGDLAIKINDDDSPMTKKIKSFMAFNGIIDIKYRTLFIPELLRIQGFGDEYELIGTLGEQKKYIGNAVHPLVSQRMVECQYRVMNQNVAMS